MARRTLEPVPALVLVLALALVNQTLAIRVSCSGGACGGVSAVDVPARDYVGVFVAGGFTHEYRPNGNQLYYDVPAGAGKWRVKCTFVENWFNAPRKRVFSVYANGVNIASNLDVFDTKGINTPHIVQADVQVPTQGILTIRLAPSIENAFITAIDISKPPPPPPTAGNTQAPNLQITFARVQDNYPLHVFEAGGTVIKSGSETKLIVFGGFRGFPNITRLVYARPFGTASTRAPWERMPDLPAPVSTHMAQTVHGSLFCTAGGFVGAFPGISGRHSFCFDFETKMYTKLPDLPQPRAGGGLAITSPKSVDDDITLVYSGGVVRDAANSHTDFGTTWSIKLGDRAWRNAGADMLDPRNHMAAVNSCGRVFFVGGQHHVNEETGNRATVSEWLPASSNWSSTPPPPLPVPLGHVSASVMAYKCGVLVIGGITNGRNMYDGILYWHPNSNRWVRVGTYPHKVATPVCGIHNDILMCATGGRWDLQNRVYAATIRSL